jgi:hypothetical protein
VPLRAVALDPLDMALAAGGDNGLVYLVDLYTRPTPTHASASASAPAPAPASLVPGAADGMVARALSAQGVLPRTLTALLASAETGAPDAPRILAGHKCVWRVILVVCMGSRLGAPV